jgi:hypothetical protein
LTYHSRQSPDVGALEHGLQAFDIAPSENHARHITIAEIDLPVCLRFHGFQGCEIKSSVLLFDLLGLHFIGDHQLVESSSRRKPVLANVNNRGPCKNSQSPTPPIASTQPNRTSTFGGPQLSKGEGRATAHGVLNALYNVYGLSTVPQPIGILSSLLVARWSTNYYINSIGRAQCMPV